MSDDAIPPRAVKAIVSLTKESDRAVAVLAVSYLDQLLFEILSNALRPSPAKRDKLLDGRAGGPLGTYSARTRMAYRLGLINAKMRKALQEMGKIRNQFAHGWDVCYFDEPSIKQKTESLLAFWPGFDPQLVQLSETARSQEARVQFILIAAVIAGYLEAILSKNLGIKLNAGDTVLPVTPADLMDALSRIVRNSEG